MTYRIPEGHEYHLTEEERRVLGDCDAARPTTISVAEHLMDRGLLHEVRFLEEHEYGHSEVHWDGPPDLTDNGRQALALYDALGDE